MFNSFTPVPQSNYAKPSNESLGNRFQQFELGEEALAKGDLAKALKWFTYASIPRPQDSTSAFENELRIAAERKVEEVKNKMAAIELQRASPRLYY